MKKESKLTGERVNYMKSGDQFVGYPVNLRGVTAQAPTVEELEVKIRTMSKGLLDVIGEMVSMPMEMVEMTDFDDWLYGNQESKVRKELARYKEIYGELPK
jgi:hypothetical protein